jgi:hypothetical protein
MKIQVYLNEGRDHAAALRLAATFEHSTLPTIPDTHSVLEQVFEKCNHIDWHDRSLLVGDVVIIGEVAWTCANAGWERITTDDLLDAISRFHHVTA